MLPSGGVVRDPFLESHEQTKSVCEMFWYSWHQLILSNIFLSKTWK